MVLPELRAVFGDKVIEIEFGEEFEDVKIKGFLNIERMKRVRFCRQVRRARLELLWGTTIIARLCASCCDIPERDTFNLRGLFNMEQEKDEIDLTYAKEWVSKHEDLWEQVPVKFEELPQGNLDDYPFNEVLERVRELGAHRSLTEEEQRREDEERAWVEWLEEWWLSP